MVRKWRDQSELGIQGRNVMKEYGLNNWMRNIIVQTQIEKSKMDRNSFVFDKMQEINDSMTQKFNRMQGTDSIQSKLNMTKKKMNQAMKKNREDLDELFSSALELHSRVETANNEYDQQSNRQMERVKAISNQVTEQLQLDILSQKEKENSIISSFEQKIQFLRSEIQKEQKARDILFSQVTETLEDDLPTIMNQILEGREHFEEEQQRIDCLTDELLDQSQKNLAAFSGEHEQNSQKAFSLIKDLTKKIKSQFEQEKTACSVTHEEVITYVEEACNKMGVSDSM